VRPLSHALITALAMTLAGSPSVRAADAERGRILYEAKCGGCHAESVHGREKRLATSFDGIRGWVLRWSANLGLAWSGDEVDDVSLHLNANYYRFQCPVSVCSTTGQRGANAPAMATAEAAATPRDR
jgi:hypothetical protein